MRVDRNKVRDFLALEYEKEISELESDILGLSNFIEKYIPPDTNSLDGSMNRFNMYCEEDSMRFYLELKKSRLAYLKENLC